jgi:hypothetical protein
MLAADFEARGRGHPPRAPVYHNAGSRHLFQMRVIGDFLRRILGLTTIVYGAFTHRS